MDVDIEVTVSSGTYVRALARDLGIALACGGHLTALRRTRVGGFGLDAAHPLDELMAIEGPMPVIPLAQAAAAAFPTRTLSDQEEWKVGVGQRIASEEPGRLGPVAALTTSGRLAALLDEQASTARSLVVFPAE